VTERQQKINVAKAAGKSSHVAQFFKQNFKKIVIKNSVQNGS
jgi:hypothetical protein